VVQQDIERAVAILRRGGLVAFPTETVYGLGADAQRAEAVERIFAAKGRPSDHPVIVHVPAGADLGRWAARVPVAAERLAERFWPGPLTLVLPRGPRVPDAVTGGQNTVALRVPDHPLALALLSAFGDGIAAPSANRFGRVSPTLAEHVREELGSAVDLILDGGPCRVGLESTILSLVNDRPRVLRPGAITAAEIAEVLQETVGSGPGATAIRAPGLLDAHYAPSTPMTLVPAPALVDEAMSLHRRGSAITVLARVPMPVPLRPILGEGTKPVVWIVAPASSHAYAHALYATLRAIDRRQVERILVEEPPAIDEWTAVTDRLRRASHG